MAATLVALFIFTHFYRKKETTLTKLEVDYYEKIKALRNSPADAELKRKVQEAAQAYAKARGLSEEALEKMIQQDLPNHS